LMTTKQLASIAVAFVAGFLVASFVHSDGMSRALPVSRDVGAPSTGASVDVSALRTEYEHQIANLKIQLETVRAQAEVNSGASMPVAQTYEERQRLYEQQRELRFAANRQIETNSLLAAGFTQNRIDWIRKRDAELAVEYRRKQTLAEQQGKPLDTSVQTSHIHDGDIDLRYELGDEEYARYRKALGRSVGMRVGQVLPGGSGESSGLKAGDEIISYNGVRVFKSMESGASIVVDVVRNGQTIRLSVPAGDMSIRAPAPLPTNEQNMHFAKETSGVALAQMREIDAKNANSGSR
jgi:predicted metal-dependent hydrolase